MRRRDPGREVADRRDPTRARQAQQSPVKPKRRKPNENIAFLDPEIFFKTYSMISLQSPF